MGKRGEYCERCEKKFKRHDLFMLNDNLWEKLIKSEKLQICWDCLNDLMQEKLKRKPKKEDFTQYSHTPYNIGNKEIQKLLGTKGVPEKIHIEIMMSKDQQYTIKSVVLDTKTFREIVKEKRERIGSDYEKAVEKAQNILKELKKKYPEAKVFTYDHKKESEIKLATLYLDKLANLLETNGMRKYALEIDLISDKIENTKYSAFV